MSVDIVKSLGQEIKDFHKMKSSDLLVIKTLRLNDPKHLLFKYLHNNFIRKKIGNVSSLI